MKTTGIFGGSFNPPHMGHLILAQLAAEAAGLDEVLFIPARIPPHKSGKTLAGEHHRLKMLEIATGNNPDFLVSDMEIQRKGPSYTLTTVQKLKKKCAGKTQLTLILGADSVRDIHSWYGAEELVRSVKILGLGRRGVDENDFEDLNRALGRHMAEKLKNSFLRLPLIEISASDIRKRVREGRPIRYLVPDAVREYIREKKLYRQRRDGRKGMMVVQE